MTVYIPKSVLKQVLEFASLYGPSGKDKGRHAVIPGVNLHFKDGGVSAYTKTHPVNTSTTCAHFYDKKIKGDEVIRLGKINKIIGGRDDKGTSWKSVIEGLSDLVSIDVFQNDVVFDSKKDYEVSVSLIDEKLSMDTNLDPKKFESRIEFKGEKIIFDDEELECYIKITGQNLVDIVSDQQRMDSNHFTFGVTDEKQKIMVMQLGNKSRSSRRKIPLIDVNLDGGTISESIFTGVEAFSNAIDPEKNVVIFYIEDRESFIFYQNADDRVIMLEGGKSVDDN